MGRYKANVNITHEKRKLTYIRNGNPDYNWAHRFTGGTSSTKFVYF